MTGQTEEAELQVWLLGVSEPLRFPMSNEHARGFYQAVDAAWAQESPVARSVSRTAP